MSDVALFNTLLALRSPTVRDLAMWAPRPLDALGMSIALGENVFATKFPLTRSRDDAPIASVTLIAISSYFRRPVPMQPTSLPGLHALGVPLDASAATVLESLHNANVGPLTLSTEMGSGFRIRVGGAFEIYFFNDAIDLTPESSRLTSVTFYYGVPCADPRRYLVRGGNNLSGEAAQQAG